MTSWVKSSLSFNSLSPWLSLKARQPNLVSYLTQCLKMLFHAFRNVILMKVKAEISNSLNLTNWRRTFRISSLPSNLFQPLRLPPPLTRKNSLSHSFSLSFSHPLSPLISCILFPVVILSPPLSFSYFLIPSHSFSFSYSQILIHLFKFYHSLSFTLPFSILFIPILSFFYPYSLIPPFSLFLSHSFHFHSLILILSCLCFLWFSILFIPLLSLFHSYSPIPPFFLILYPFHSYFLNPQFSLILYLSFSFLNFLIHSLSHSLVLILSLSSLLVLQLSENPIDLTNMASPYLLSTLIDSDCPSAVFLCFVGSN